MNHYQSFYTPPELEICEVAIEQGYSLSGYGNDSDDSEFGYPEY